MLGGRGTSSNNTSTVNTSHAERIPKTLPTPFQPTQQQPATPPPASSPAYASQQRSHDGRRLGTPHGCGSNSRPGLAPVQQLKRSKGRNLCKLFSRLFRYAIFLFLLPLLLSPALNGEWQVWSMEQAARSSANPGV